MKKISLILLTAAGVAALSCNKVPQGGTDASGILSFDGFTIQQSEEVETKAAYEAPGNYMIAVLDNKGNTVKSTSYSETKAEGFGFTLPAGHYTLAARSQADVPVAAFEQAVFGAVKEFDIEAGNTTPLSPITCTLLSCKVTVSYSDDFLAMVTGPGAASVEVTAGHPLDFSLNYENGKATYDQSAGYFAINNGMATTLTVTFKGNIEGKSQKMTKTISGVQPKQWRQIRFVKKSNEEGNATFDVEINEFVTDSELNGFDDPVSEDIIGEDPDAPKGDGGINLEFDYEAGCDADFTDLENIVMPPLVDGSTTINLHLKAVIPNGIKKFTVDIASTNDAFVAAVAAAEATSLDLINPTETNAIIFQVVPFPHGAELLGQTEVKFDMTAAQAAIVNYPGTHTFSMNIIDEKGCKKSIPIVMIVE